MKYAVEMGSSSVIYILSFIQIDSGIHKYMAAGGIDRHTQTAWRSNKPKLKLKSVALVRKRTISTERPPLVDEVSANFCG
jgi:hypothetical protein